MSQKKIEAAVRQLVNALEDDGYADSGQLRVEISEKRRGRRRGKIVLQANSETRELDFNLPRRKAGASDVSDAWTRHEETLAHIEELEHELGVGQ